MTRLSARELSCDLGSTRILHGIDLSLESGEMVGLVGPNGAGKSTLLKTLVGFYSASTGSVELEGAPLDSYGSLERAKRISYLSQEGPESFPFTALEVAEMGGFPSRGFWRSPGEAGREDALRALRYVGMEDFAERSFPSLSGGERQMVLFARAIAQDTPVLLLDEPTANLDMGHENRLLSMVRELCREGKSALVAIHNLNLAAEFCDRLVVLDRGKVDASGTPESVLDADRLERLYSTNVTVDKNPSTGSLSIQPVPAFRQRTHKKIHVIGGAGSAVYITRHLVRMGFSVSGGVAHAMDSDARLWESLGLDHVRVQPFASIDDDSYEAALHLVEAADTTILCAFPFGPGNLRNLELAEAAVRAGGELLVLEQHSTDCPREFYGDAGRAMWDKIVDRHGMMSATEALDHIRDET